MMDNHLKISGKTSHFWETWIEQSASLQASVLRNSEGAMALSEPKIH